MDVGLLSTVKVLMSFNEDVAQRRSRSLYVRNSSIDGAQQ